MKKTIIAALTSSLIFSATLNTAIASQADLEKEINQYSEIFSGSNFNKQRSAMSHLVWSGLSSPKIYDAIANNLNGSLNTKDKEEVEKASWAAKTLALSGNSKYRPLLIQASNSAVSPKLKKYSKTALERLDKYINWNPIISQGLTSAPNGQLELTRVINMLNANDYELIRIGAKRAYKEFSDNPQVLDIIVKKLERETDISKKENMRIDSVAWLIKVLGGTGNAQYKTVLETVIANNKNKKVRKHANKAIKSL